jgi:tetratricopeptide (TPR) repeat protein
MIVERRGSQLAMSAVDTALAALRRKDLGAAERILRHHLATAAEDVVALRLLAATCAKRGQSGEAIKLLRRLLEISPRLTAERWKLTRLLFGQKRFKTVLAELETLLEAEPENLDYLGLKADALLHSAAPRGCADFCETVLTRHQPTYRLLLAYGNALKEIGRAPESAAAFRRAIDLHPRRGGAWWSLSNLKVEKLHDAEVERLAALARDSGAKDKDRMYLHFALGHGLEQRGDVAGAFASYETANRLRRASISYQPHAIEEEVAAAKAVYSRAFFAARSRQGAPSAAPIFILGMPRAGSTLVEQILASHSQVEGTSELKLISNLAKRLDAKHPRGYPACLEDLGSEALRGLGSEYLRASAAFRQGSRPFFIDKMPENWLHVGFIKLILPNAKIIDARRHPMDCGLGNFRQYYPTGREYAYDLAEFGLYYRAYVDLMAHFDDVLPAYVHRVIHERLVANLEEEVRRLLDHLELPFEEACLRFWETDRVVRTASAEQVRRPISAEALDRWRSFEPWLRPLAHALGEALVHYPDDPPAISSAEFV